MKMLDELTDSLHARYSDSFTRAGMTARAFGERLFARLDDIIDIISEDEKDLTIQHKLTFNGLASPLDPAAMPTIDATNAFQVPQDEIWILDFTTWQRTAAADCFIMDSSQRILYTAKPSTNVTLDGFRLTLPPGTFFYYTGAGATVITVVAQWRRVIINKPKRVRKATVGDWQPNTAGSGDGTHDEDVTARHIPMQDHMVGATTPNM